MTFTKPVPKETTPRDPAYLDFIRSHNCAECGWPAHLGQIEAHHVETGGTGIKCSDYLTVALCGPRARGCHRKADKTPSSIKKYLPLTKRYVAEYVRQGGKIKG